MNREFLLCAAAVLAIRFAALAHDPVPRKTWMAITVAQLMVLGLFIPTTWSLVAAAALLAGNLVELWREQRAGGREGVHLLVVVGQFVILSICFSDGAHPAFRFSFAGALRWAAEWSAFGGGLGRATEAPHLLLFVGLLLAVGEGDRLVRLLLQQIKATPAGAMGQLDFDEYRRGRVIGMLERGLIFLFAVAGQFGAVGFVVAAKALVHARRTPERDLTYYVLIGTLASSSVALVAGLLVRRAASG